MSCNCRVLVVTCQPPGSRLPHGKAGICIHTIDLALDIEDRVNPFHRLQCDGRDVMGGLVLAQRAIEGAIGSSPMASARDVGQLKKFAPRVAPAERAARRAGAAVSQIQIVIAAIGIGLQNALPACEMLVGVDHLAIARELEQGSRWRTAIPRLVIAHIGPEPRSFGAATRHKRHRRIIAVQARCGQHVALDQFVDRAQRHTGMTDQISQGGQAQIDTLSYVVLTGNLMQIMTQPVKKSHFKPAFQLASSGPKPLAGLPDKRANAALPPHNSPMLGAPL